MFKRLIPLALVAVVGAVLGFSGLASADCSSGPCPLPTKEPKSV